MMFAHATPHNSAGMKLPMKIAQLLLRFIAPDTDEITVDGVPLSQIDAAEWRTHIGWVPQMPYLFDGSIIENIKLARPNADFADVQRAAKLARADSFIANLTAGVQHARR